MALFEIHRRFKGHFLNELCVSFHGLMSCVKGGGSYASLLEILLIVFEGLQSIVKKVSTQFP